MNKKEHKLCEEEVVHYAGWIWCYYRYLETATEAIFLFLKFTISYFQTFINVFTLRGPFKILLNDSESLKLNRNGRDVLCPIVVRSSSFSVLHPSVHLTLQPAMAPFFFKEKRDRRLDSTCLQVFPLIFFRFWMQKKQRQHHQQQGGVNFRFSSTSATMSSSIFLQS